MPILGKPRCSNRAKGMQANGVPIIDYQIYRIHIALHFSLYNQLLQMDANRWLETHFCGSTYSGFQQSGITIVAGWLSEATLDEQTTVRIIFKVLCYLPLIKAQPVQMSYILQTVNKLRFYRRSGNISNRDANSGDQEANTMTTPEEQRLLEESSREDSSNCFKKALTRTGLVQQIQTAILELQGQITSSSDHTKNIGEIGRNHSESSSKELVSKKKMRSLSSVYASETAAVGVFDHNATTVSKALISSHRKRYEKSPGYEPDKEMAVSAMNLSESSPENNDPDMVSDCKRVSSDHPDKNAASKVKRVKDSVYEPGKRQSSQNEPAGKGMAPIALNLSKSSRGNGHLSSENVVAAKVNACKKYMNLAAERRAEGVNAKVIKKESVHNNETPRVILIMKGEKKKEMADGNTAGRTENCFSMWTCLGWA